MNKFDAQVKEYVEAVQNTLSPNLITAVLIAIDIADSKWQERTEAMLTEAIVVVERDSDDHIKIDWAISKLPDNTLRVNKEILFN